MSEAAWSAAVLVAQVILVPLATLYLEERIKNVARSETESALAKQREQHEQTLALQRADHEGKLAELNAAHQRRHHEFSLYTQRQHAAYGELYSRYRQASDAYYSCFGITFEPDFKRYARADVQGYLLRQEISLDGFVGSEIMSALDANEPGRAAQLLSELHGRLRLQRAERSFQEAKNYEATEELYFSDAVRAAVSVLRQRIGEFSVRLDHPQGVANGDLLKRRGDMSAAANDLLGIIQSEVRRGLGETAA